MVTMKESIARATYITKKSKKKSKRKSYNWRKMKMFQPRDIALLLLGDLLIGILLGYLITEYFIPRYFQPHSHIRVLYSDSMLTIDNIDKAPVEWAVITVRTNSSESLVKDFKIIGSLDIRKPEPYAGGSYFWVVVNNITPKDWGAIEIEMEGPSGIQVEVESSCQYEVGGAQTVAPAPTRREWGEEESYQEWLEKHQE